jgi:hypothetical protein
MCGTIRYSAEGMNSSWYSDSNSVASANHNVPVGPKVGARAICHCAQCQKVNSLPLRMRACENSHLLQAHF